MPRWDFVKSACVFMYFAKKMAEVCSEQPLAKKRKQVERKKVFRWSDEMHSALIDCLANYKVYCEFNNIDFDADKASQYQALRKEMAIRFNNEDSAFGPVEVSEKPAGELNDDEKKIYNDLLKKEQKGIAQGYNRILEKVKILRQGFSKAVIAGRRSGSGKLVYDHYDSLRDIWGGSPNTSTLNAGIDSSSINDRETDSIHDESDTSINDDSLNSTEDDSNNQRPTSTPSSAVPKLIDNKRKHMERRLSAAQRDFLFMEEAKNDKVFRKELTDAIKESTVSMAQALQGISTSMVHVSTMLARSMEVMAHSSSVSQAPNLYSHTTGFQSYHELNTSPPFNHNAGYQTNQGHMPVNMTSQQNVPPTFQYLGND